MSTLFFFAACPVPEAADMAPRAADTAPSPIIDQDGDGWLPPDDCDDLDPLAYPGAIDSWFEWDEIDQDCNGEDGPFMIAFYGDGGWSPAGDFDRDGRADYINHDYFYRDGSTDYLLLSSRGWSDGGAAMHLYEANTTSAGDLDGDGADEFVASGWGAVRVYSGAAMYEWFTVANTDWPGWSTEVPVPEMANQTVRLLGALDAGAGVLLQVGEYVMPRERLLEPGFTVGGAPWRFPDLPVSWSNASSGYPGPVSAGDLDGDGLMELLAPDVLFPGDLLSAGGSFPIATGENIAGLGGFLGDVDGDGLEDAWVYEAADDGAVHLVGAPLLEAAALSPFATIVGDTDTFLPSAAGGLGDADEDGHADVGTGVGPVVNPWGYEGDTYLFRGVRLSGTIGISTYDRRIDWYAASVDHLDFDGDGIDEPLLTNTRGTVGVVGGTALFPTP